MKNPIEDKRSSLTKEEEAALTLLSLAAEVPPSATLDVGYELFKLAAATRKTPNAEDCSLFKRYFLCGPTPCDPTPGYQSPEPSSYSDRKRMPTRKKPSSSALQKSSPILAASSSSATSPSPLLNNHESIWYPAISSKIAVKCFLRTLFSASSLEEAQEKIGKMHQGQNDLDQSKVASWQALLNLANSLGSEDRGINCGQLLEKIQVAVPRSEAYNNPQLKRKAALQMLLCKVRESLEKPSELDEELSCSDDDERTSKRPRLDP